jgi:hypothetical protein
MKDIFYRHRNFRFIKLIQSLTIDVYFLFHSVLTIKVRFIYTPQVDTVKLTANFFKF